MSRREIDANNNAKARYRESRIERIIEELRIIADDWDGKDAPLDVERKRALLEDELRELEGLRAAEAAVVDAPTIEQKVEILNSAVLSIYPEITSIKRSLSDWQQSETTIRTARNAVIDRWIITLLALNGLSLGAVVALYAYVIR